MFLFALCYSLIAYISLVASSPTSPFSIAARQNTPDSTAPDSDKFKAQYRLYGFVGCSNPEKDAIYAAFREKDTITGSPGVWNIDWNGAAAVDYFGNISYLMMLQTRARDSLQKNFRNIYNFGDGFWFFRKNTQVFCHDLAIDGDKKRDCSRAPGHIVTVGQYADSHDAMMFCDSWFKLPDLETAKRNGLTSHEPFDITNYDNRALYLISAICLKHDVCPWPAPSSGVPATGHRSFNFGEPHGRHFLSTPSAIKYYSQLRNSFQLVYVISNVDMYAWFAMTAYIQESGNLGHYPLRPYVPDELNFDGWVANEADAELMKQLDLDMGA
ncbi:hypothetical protein EJ02DRAFT_469181 [Clathrospora elynae]|uniref:Uncharacterized protein n=1 Tax=Clathrospora elynae TaxID=706981 RepID=A0A6A5SE40_9PLEO|nr:hypothetical protein EJ02DRAFT_469181 [Clathrospora elynae]